MHVNLACTLGNAPIMRPKWPPTSKKWAINFLHSYRPRGVVPYSELDRTTCNLQQFWQWQIRTARKWGSNRCWKGMLTRKLHHTTCTRPLSVRPGVCSICWIFSEFMGALIDFPITLQWNRSHLLDAKQLKFTETSTHQLILGGLAMPFLLTFFQTEVLGHQTSYWKGTLFSGLS